jgi:hypothetical protein
MGYRASLLPIFRFAVFSIVRDAVESDAGSVVQATASAADRKTDAIFFISLIYAGLMAQR